MNFFDKKYICFDANFSKYSLFYLEEKNIADLHLL